MEGRGGLGNVAPGGLPYNTHEKATRKPMIPQLTEKIIGGWPNTWNTKDGKMTGLRLSGDGDKKMRQKRAHK